MTTVRRLLFALGIPVLAMSGAVAFTAPSIVGASPASEVRDGVNATNETAGTKDAPQCGPERKPHECTLTDYVGTVVSVLLFAIGTVSVIMIIIGGIRYATSNGESSQITAAKNTIMYAVIGLVVALLSYAIVNFIVIQFA